MQLHPQSLQLYELMCWCWSDKPQHRPTFEQILKIVKKDSFTHLLEAVPVTSSRKNLVTSACVKFNSTSPQKGTASSAPSSDDLEFQYGTTTKVLSPVEIWYGTKTGSCGKIRFQHPVTIKVCKQRHAHTAASVCVHDIIDSLTTNIVFSHAPCMRAHTHTHTHTQ